MIVSARILNIYKIISIAGIKFSIFEMFFEYFRGAVRYIIMPNCHVQADRSAALRVDNPGHLHGQLFFTVAGLAVENVF
ncbi:hypothetical protein WS67_07095 [Burkholderia singularis]|uniref:Uncharacterized protein n=1 Tax=Burkholderia singularis TaxID=1503053 RepID=A0A118DPS2_9BURK|nr:hypothetical protein WS67_07095 [Burkholderia singularis]